jgi:ABC-2 type transport system ATP-binding protein
MNNSRILGFGGGNKFVINRYPLERRQIDVFSKIPPGRLGMIGEGNLTSGSCLTMERLPSQSSDSTFSRHETHGMTSASQTTAASALSMRSLSYAYGTKPALTNVTFDIARGRFTALLGHNGAGKSTLFALALRLLQPPPDTVFIAGRELVEAGAAALAPLGIVFQEPTLDLDLTVRQNLTYFAALRGLSAAETLARMTLALTSIGMDQAIDQRIRTLSGGQRRRIEIARALLHRPSILLLDEPTAGLDIPSRRAIVDHVHTLATNEGVAVLWATHLIDEVGDGDNIVILHHGRVVSKGSLAEVIQAGGGKSLAESFATLAPVVARAAA